MQLLLAMILFAAVLVFIGQIQRKRQRENEILRLKKLFGKPSVKKMSSERYAKVPACFLRHRPLQEIDDVTWNDLEMDVLYHQMDSTMSAAGEEYLYALLRSGSGEMNIPLSTVRAMEQDSFTDERIALQLALRRLGHAGRYSLYDYLDALTEAPRESNLVHLPAFLLPLCSLILMEVSVRAGILCLIGSFVLNILTYYPKRGQADPYITSLGYLLRMLDCSDRILRLHGAAFPKEKEILQQALRKCRDLQKGSWVLLSGTVVSDGNPLSFLADYLRILFHLDLIRLNSMLESAAAHREDLEQILLLLGKMDACIALASFEKSLPYTCAPSILPADIPHADSGRLDRLAIKGLYHPLLKKPVANDIETNRCILLTGSNASGKSTFLKAVAICALLAQTAGFCPARGYQGIRYKICSSMALRDSIVKGESYFMAEIRSLKRICDLSENSNPPVLCFVDEVLRGTNTVERIAASAEILKALAASGALCFAATHDIELTSLLAEDYDNYHFEEELKQDDVTFSYLLRKGPAMTRNAIRLLETVGYDKAVTQGAFERAAAFEATGQWK